MPKLPSNRTPSYRKHRATGQAIVVLSGKMFYLGPHGSQAGQREYDRVTVECRSPMDGVGPPSPARKRSPWPKPCSAI